MKLLGLGLLLILLTGCTSITSAICDGYCKKNFINTVETKIVKVPVLQCPTNHTSIKRGEKPILAISVLTAEDKKDPGKVAQAYKITVKQLIGYAQQTKYGFDTYRKMCIAAGKRIPK